MIPAPTQHTPLPGPPKGGHYRAMKCHARLRTWSRTRAEASGLCATCAHAEPVASSRGSAFVLCRLSVVDPAFPKYPRLPVLACDGYRRDDQA